MRFRFFHALALCLLLSTSVSARPTVGLALGGGGAKGAAHIGVIRLLEEQQIPVDYVSGTSMGAYFGAMFALGYTADEMAESIANTDWNSAYIDDVNREDLSLRKKQQRDDYQLGFVFGVNRQGLQLPKGAVQGQTMAALIRSMTHDLESLESFDELPIPFRSVATDMELMQPVVMGSGSLATAVQASMSVQGALRPIERDGRLLSDGGVVNNLPIDVLLEQGADIIIAVDIGDKLSTKEELNSAVSIIAQLSNYLVVNSTQKQIELLRDQDILIKPDITGLSATTFELMPLATERGYQAAEQQIKQLAELFSADDYQQAQVKIAQRKKAISLHQKIRVTEVRLNNRSNLNDDLVLKRFGISSDTQVSNQDIENGVERLYQLGLFERVDIELVNQEDGNIVALDVVEKSWGPGFFDMKFMLQENFDDQTDISLGLAFTLSNWNKLGGEWRNEVEIGRDNRIFTELYSPFDNALNFAWSLSASKSRINRRVYGIGAGNSYLDAQFSDYMLGSSLLYTPEQWREYSIGLNYQNGKVQVAGLNERADYQIVSPYLKFQHDTLDSWSFPTQGSMLSLSYLLNYESVDYFETSDYSADYISHGFDGQWKFPFGYKHHRFDWFGEFGGTDSESIVPITIQDLGGFLRLSGFQYESLSGRYKAFSGVKYFYQVTNFANFDFRAPLYLGGSVEYGGIWNELEDISSDSAIWAGSLFTALDTNWLGPVVFSFGYNQQETSVYLFIGNDF